MFKYFFTDKDKTKFIKRSLFCDSSYLRYIAVKHFVVLRGITNPFSLLLIVPAIVSSTFLSMGTTITLVSTTTLSLVILTFSHHPLPGSQDYLFKFPSFYLAGILISILIGLFFLSYFGIRFSTETKKRSDAGSRLQQVIAKEYELESLGGQAAAAAHSLGTPLATISVIARELKKDIGEKSTHSSDLDLLISQTKGAVIF